MSSYGLALRRRQRRQVGAPGRRGGHGHARAHVHAREDQRRARAQRVDQQHVQPVAHRQVHVGAGCLGQFRQVQARRLPEVEGAQVGVAQLQRGRTQAVALAAGRLAQVAGGQQRGHQARHGGFGNAGAFGQLAVGQRLIGVGHGLEHRQAPRQGADLLLALRERFIGHGGHLHFLEPCSIFALTSYNFETSFHFRDTTGDTP
jgi:hypothetical protein